MDCQFMLNDPKGLVAYCPENGGTLAYAVQPEGDIRYCWAMLGADLGEYLSRRITLAEVPGLPCHTSKIDEGARELAAYNLAQILGLSVPQDWVREQLGLPERQPPVARLDWQLEPGAAPPAVPPDDDDDDDDDTPIYVPTVPRR